MEFKVNTIDKCKREVEFDISAGEILPYFEKAYLKYRNKVNVPGFRKGKTPVSIIKKLYGEAIEHDSLEDIAAETFNKYLRDEHIHTLGEGSLIDMKYTPGTDFKFKIQYEVKPEFELKKYIGLDVTRPVYEVDEKMAEDEIKYLQGKHSTYENAEKAVDDEYVITVELQKVDSNNFPIIGYKQDNIKIYLNDSSMDEKFRTQLRNIDLNESRLVKLRNRDKNEDENYSLKAVRIEKIIYPELSPDFFKKISKKEIKEIAEFKNFIKEDLGKIYNRISEQELENNIISEIIKSNEVPAPDALVDRILTSKIDEIRSKHPKRELPPDFDAEEYKKNNNVDVILQVKWLLIKEKIIGIEKLEVSAEEIDNSVLEYSSKYNLPVDKVRSLFDRNDDLKYDLLNKKLMVFLKDKSNIKEVRQTHETESRIYA
jgi:trigger factor